MIRISKKATLLLGAALLTVSATGCKVTKTQDGKMPDVEVSAKGGQLPKYDVKTPTVDGGEREARGRRSRRWTSRPRSATSRCRRSTSSRRSKTLRIEAGKAGRDPRLFLLVEKFVDPIPRTKGNAGAGRSRAGVPWGVKGCVSCCWYFESVDGLLARAALVRDVELLGIDLLVAHPDLGAVVALRPGAGLEFSKVRYLAPVGTDFSSSAIFVSPGPYQATFTLEGPARRRPSS